eukprot:GDKJ01022906.1.p1 GENE.GDKJ01022906.1~~GDKJ01022906.1.p1  ORF type:complete len:1607 (-),score=396.08 GDKJ01022906.1:328-5148(-)
MNSEVYNLTFLFPDGQQFKIVNLDSFTTIRTIFMEPFYPVCFAPITDCQFKGDIDIDAPLSSFLTENSSTIEIEHISWNERTVSSHLIKVNQLYSGSEKFLVMETSSDVPVSKAEDKTGIACAAVSDSSTYSIFTENSIPNISSLFESPSVSSPPIAVVTTSGWNPPSLADLSKGVVSYLEVSYAGSSKSVLVVACYNGFRVLAVSGKDGVVNTPQPSHSSFSHCPPHDIPAHAKPKNLPATPFSTLLNLVSYMAPPNFKDSLAALLHVAPSTASATLKSTVRLLGDISNEMFPHHRFLLSTNSSTHVYNTARSNLYEKCKMSLLTGCGGAISPGNAGVDPSSKRDWQAELQEVREAPRDDNASFSTRGRLNSALICDWSAAACETAKLVFSGAISALDTNAYDNRSNSKTFVAGDVLVVSPSAEVSSVSLSNPAKSGEVKENDGIAVKTYSRKALSRDNLSNQLLMGLDMAFPRVSVDDLQSSSDYSNNKFSLPCDEEVISPLLTSTVDVIGHRQMSQTVVAGAFSRSTSLPIHGFLSLENHIATSEQNSGENQESLKDDLMNEFKFVPLLHLKSRLSFGRSLGWLSAALDFPEGKQPIMLPVECKATTGTDGNSCLIDVTRVTPIDRDAVESTDVIRPELVSQFLLKNDPRVTWAKIVDEGIASESSLTSDDENEDQIPPPVRTLRSFARALRYHATGPHGLVDFSFKRLELEMSASRMILNALTSMFDSSMSYLLALDEELAKETDEIEKALKERQDSFEVQLAAVVEKMEKSGKTTEEIDEVKKKTNERIEKDKNMKQNHLINASSLRRNHQQVLESVRAFKTIYNSEIVRFKKLIEAVRNHSDLNVNSESIMFAPSPMMELDVTPILFPIDGKPEEGTDLSDEWSTKVRETLARRMQKSSIQELLNDILCQLPENASNFDIASAIDARVDSFSASYPSPQFDLNENLSILSTYQKNFSAQSQNKQLHQFKIEHTLPIAAKSLERSISCQSAISCVEVKHILHRNGLSLRDLGLVINFLSDSLNSFDKKDSKRQQELNDKRFTIKVLKTVLLARALSSVCVASLQDVPTFQCHGAVARLITLSLSMSSTPACRDHAPPFLKSCSFDEFRSAVVSRLVKHYPCVATDLAKSLFSLLSCPSARFMIVNELCRKTGVTLTPEGLSNLLSGSSNSPALSWKFQKDVDSSSSILSSYHAISSKHIHNFYPVVKSPLPSVTLSTPVKAALLAATRLLLLTPAISSEYPVAPTNIMQVGVLAASSILDGVQELMLATSPVAHAPLFPLVTLTNAAALSSLPQGRYTFVCPSSSGEGVAFATSKACLTAEAVYGQCSTTLVTALSLRAQALCACASDTTDSALLIQAQAKQAELALREASTIKDASDSVSIKKAKHEIDGLLKAAESLRQQCASLVKECCAVLVRCTRLERLFVGSGLLNADDEEGATVIAPSWALKAVTVSHLCVVIIALRETQESLVTVSHHSNLSVDKKGKKNTAATTSSSSSLILPVDAEVSSLTCLLQSIVHTLPYVVAIEGLLRLAGLNASRGDIPSTEKGLTLTRLAFESLPSTLFEETEEGRKCKSGVGLEIENMSKALMAQLEQLKTKNSK